MKISDSEDILTDGDAMTADKAENQAEESFKKITDVLKYLEGQGWRITRPTLYRHHNEGKLALSQDGTFKQKAVERYAKTFLKQAATGKRIKENTEDLQRQKLEEELKNLRLKNERDAFNHEKDKGKFISRSQRDIEVAGIIGLLLSEFKNLITTKAADWIALSGGDHKKIGEVITKAIEGIDEMSNAIAKLEEVDVVIDGAETETAQEAELLS